MVTTGAVTRWLPPFAVGVVSFLVLLTTLQPGVDFWDTAELQAVGPLMGTAHPTGFPAYVLLGWFASVVLAPFGEPAFRMNLLAAICVAAAAGVTVDLTRALTRSVALGVAAGLGLAATGIVWSIGTHAETHALHLLLAAVLFRSLIAWADAEPGRSRDRRLLLSAIVYGVAMANHSLTLLLAPGIGLYVLAVEPSILRRPRLVLACGAALLLTTGLLFLELPLRAGPFRAPLVYGHPETWDGFWSIVLAEQFRGSLVAPFSDLPLKVAELASRTVTAFGVLAALIPAGFVVTALLRPRYALLSGVSVAITCFFAASYVNADIGRYYLVPALLAWTWLAILAGAVVRVIVDERLDRDPRLRSATTLALTIALLIPTGLAFGGRATEVDRSGNVDARRWLDSTLEAMEPDAVIVSWWSYSTPLWYAQHVQGRRPDVAIIDDRTRLDEDLGDIYDVIDSNLPARPVYVIRADPREVAELERRYVLDHLAGVDARTLTRVVATREGGA